MVLRRRRKSGIPRAGPFPPGWDVPARFNFTRDVVEALGAGDSLRKGVAYVDREGIVDRRTFSDVAKDAARWAHLLRTRLDRGDRVLIVLGKVPAWHGAMIGHAMTQWTLPVGLDVEIDADAATLRMTGSAVE